MTSVQIITDTQELIDAMNEFARFLKWDWFIGYTKIAARYDDFDHSFIITGLDTAILDKRNLLQQIRKRNPLQPLVFIGGEVKPEQRQEFDIFSPVYFCAWPFNSKNFIGILQEADQESVKTRKIARKIKTVFKLFDQKKSEEAKKNILSLKKLITPYLFQVLMARCQLIGGHLTEALQFATEAANTRPDSSEALELIAKINDGLGSKEAAITMLEANAQTTESDMDCLVLAGNLALESGDLKKSRKFFNKALAKDANDVQAKDGAMAVGIIDGDIKSIKSDKGAIETSMKLARVCNEKAIALVKAQNYLLAEKLYVNTINLLPDKSIEFKLFMNLGLCMKKAEKMVKALDYFKTGKDRSPPGYSRFDEQIEFVKAALETK